MPGIKIERKAAPDCAIFEIKGMIDDIADFAPIIKSPDLSIIIDFDGVTNANSFGIGIWSRFITSIKERKIRYQRCRPVVITQINVVHSLIKGVEVLSFYAPFECSGCQTEQEILISMETAREPEFVTSINDKFSCSSCNRNLTLLEDAENYLEFLTNMSP